MTDAIEYDVFLSHSSKDKAVVRGVAERLRKDGLRVWFDEWVLKPGDSIPAKIEEGLEHSRVLVLCMSANAFGSDWAQLEAGTFRLSRPAEQGAPLHSPAARRRPHQRLPGAIPLHQLASEQPRRRRYPKLVEACRPPAKPQVAERQVGRDEVAEKFIQLGYKAGIRDYAFSPDGKRALTDADNNSLLLWDVETGQCCACVRRP